MMIEPTKYNEDDTPTCPYQGGSCDGEECMWFDKQHQQCAPVLALAVIVETLAAISKEVKKP